MSTDKCERDVMRVETEPGYLAHAHICGTKLLIVGDSSVVKDELAQVPAATAIEPLRAAALPNLCR